MFSDVVEEIIFPSFLVSCKPDIDLNKLKKESYDIKQNFTSVSKSNFKGYQSPSFNFQHNDCGKSEFVKLEKNVCQFVQSFLNAKKYNLSLHGHEWWLNINSTSSYNVLHHHKRADLISIFYIQCDDSSSCLTLMRDDGSTYCSLYKNKPEEMSLTIPPVSGRLYLLPGHLWHYVTSNSSYEDRISVSYNFILQ